MMNALKTKGTIRQEPEVISMVKHLKWLQTVYILESVSPFIWQFLLGEFST